MQIKQLVSAVLRSFVRTQQQGSAVTKGVLPKRGNAIRRRQPVDRPGEKFCEIWERKVVGHPFVRWSATSIEKTVRTPARNDGWKDRRLTKANESRRFHVEKEII
jgi:hypothetical protein